MLFNLFDNIILYTLYYSIYIAKTWLLSQIDSYSKEYDTSYEEINHKETLYIHAPMGDNVEYIKHFNKLK